MNALSTAQSRLSEDIAGVQRELMRVAEEKAENEIGEDLYGIATNRGRIN